MKNTIIITLASFFGIGLFFGFKNLYEQREENIKLIGKKVILANDTVAIIGCNSSIFYLSNRTEINRLYLNKFKIINIFAIVLSIV